MAQLLAWLCPFSPLFPFNTSDHKHEQPPHTWPSPSEDRAITQAGDCRSFSFLSLNCGPTWQKAAPFPFPATPPHHTISTFITFSCLFPPSLFLCSASLMQPHIPSPFQGSWHSCLDQRWWWAQPGFTTIRGLCPGRSGVKGPTPCTRASAAAPHRWQLRTGLRETRMLLVTCGQGFSFSSM